MLGIWPSPVRRLSGGQEITGSNPVIPTNSLILPLLNILMTLLSKTQQYHQIFNRSSE